VKGGKGYERGLAAELPRMIPLGRQFVLARGACWSNENEKEVTASDVRSTVQLLCRRGTRGYIPEWADLLSEGDGARIEGDSYHINLTLRRGYLDPLSLFDFKILPQSVVSADDEQFALKPIGSGPYKLDKADDNRVVLVANPFYERRPGKTGLPRIREIHFVRSENPVSDFEADRLHLLLDLPTTTYKALDSAGLNSVTL